MRLFIDWSLASVFGVSLVVFAMLAPSDIAVASSLIYTPVNPQFGGNPNNGSWLLQAATAQNDFARQQQQQQAQATGSTLTPGQVFAQQLTSQLYSSLANKITQAIFGPNAQPSGTFSFQGTTINYQLVGGNIQISINDGQTISTVTVPAGP
jgi:curli production assembly/transport component CsgF